MPARCKTDMDCLGVQRCDAAGCASIGEGERHDGADPVSAPWPPSPPAPFALRPIEIPLGPPPFVMLGLNAQHNGRRGVAPVAVPRLLWQTKLGAPVTGGLVMGPDRRLYVAAHDGALYALDPDTGAIAMRAITGERSWSTPAISSDGTIYIGSDDDHVYAFAADGQIKWKARIGECDPNGFGPAGTRCDADGGPTLGRDGVVYVGGDGVSAFTANGVLLWRFATTQHVASPPTLGVDGMVYVGCQDDTFYALDRLGQLQWSVRTKGDVDGGAAIGADGTIYVGSDDGALYAIAPNNGEIRWKVLTGGDVRGTPAIGADGTVYIGSYDGYFYAIAPTGAVRWRYATGGKIHASPLIAGDAILFGSQDNSLYVLGVDGALRAALPFAGDVDATPWVSDEGTIYVAGDDGIVSAFGKAAP